MGQIGRFLVIMGIVLVVIGGALLLGRIPRLPGDIYVQRKGFTVYVPLVSSLLLSLLLTILLNVFFARR